MSNYQAKAARRLQLLREGKTKIVCRSIWLRITRKCPLECRHCFAFGSPHGESMSLDQVSQTVEHLPAGVETIGITGGEPFATPKLLRKTLECIQQRKFRSLSQTTVQTIGYWATDRQKTIDTLSELISLGVNSFYVYGNDQWHWEQGLKPESQALLVDVLKTEFNAIQPKLEGKLAEVESLFRRDRLTVSQRATGVVVAIGRAATETTRQEQTVQGTESLCKCRDFLTLHRDGYIYTIDFNGDVHFCNFMSAPPLGNIFERPLTEILRIARRSELFRVTNGGNVVEFAERFCDGSKVLVEESIQQYGRCKYHTELMKKYHIDY